MALRTLLAFLPLIVLTAAAGWSYTGPMDATKWTEVDARCGGMNQSPIDIIPGDAEYDDDLKPFVFTNYEDANPAQYHLNNAHSAKVSFNTSTSTPSISGGGLGGTYNFLQLHLHWGEDSTEGSEHLINSMAYPAEIHLVHLHSDYPTFTDADASKNPSAAAVLGVMVDVSDEDNEVFEEILEKLDDIVYSEQMTEIEGFALNKLLPKDDIDVFFRYQGSLTTPMCQELVKWTAFKEPIYMSEKQLQKLRSTLMFNKEGETSDPLTFNYRPVQPLNSRKVTTSMKPMDDGASGVAVSFVTLATALLGTLFFA